MWQVIENFPEQLVYRPVIKNSGKLKKFGRFMVLGMGGSHLAAGLVKLWKPALDLAIHSDYGLPDMPKDEKMEVLVIADSYSGDTEEVIDGFQRAKDAGMATAAIAAGGKLLELAEAAGVPYVELPDRAIQPRHALGYSTRALLALMSEDSALREIADMASSFDPKEFEAEGKTLAEALVNAIPVVYASRENFPLAYNWKIKFNETAKVPAFCNAFPELNHNEINGYGDDPQTKSLRKPFHFIFLQDAADHPRIRKRMEALREMYEERGMPVTAVDISGENIWRKIFTTLIRGDWATYMLAMRYGHDPKAVPIVEEFKRRIA